MRVRVVLLCCVALAAAKRAHREAGYNYQQPNAYNLGHSQSGYTEQSAGLGQQYHTANQQFHQLSQNDGVLASFSAQPQSNEYHTNGGDSLNYQQEYTQQNDLYRFTAPSNGFGQTYTHDASSSFANSHQHPTVDVHQTAQFQQLQRDVVNTAGDSIVVEAPGVAAPVQQQPAPIHHQPAPIHHQPAPIHHQPAPTNSVDQFPSHVSQVNW